MAVSSDAKLGRFLQEVSNWDWREFVDAEHDNSYTSNQAVIFSLIRACTMEKIDAIRTALNRLDGKLKTPIKIEMPKVYYLYPNATLPEGDMVKNDNGKLTAPADDGTTVIEGEVLPPSNISFDDAREDDDLPSMTLRETVAKMSDYPREVPTMIVQQAQNIEKCLREHTPLPDEVPRVKSVVAAHLLIMAHKRNLDAIREVFDQIDGKLAETIQLLGDDIFITIYSPTAPAGAYLNDDGVVQIEATQAQEFWAKKLGDKA